MKQELEFSLFTTLLALAGILIWGGFLFGIYIHSPLTDRKPKRFFLLSISGLLVGAFSSQAVLQFAETLGMMMRPKGKTSMLSQTVHLAFVQAGMMEEFMKTLFILFLGAIFLILQKQKKWNHDIYFIAGFVALGFAGVENYLYILPTKDGNDTYFQWIGRTFVSANIHLLVNLCFALFLIKSNQVKLPFRWIYLCYALVLSILQHGIVDFFLIPGSIFGNWLSIWFFVGIWVWVARDTSTYILTAPQQSIFES
jgi:RsiW-degrading membrane proteinase PrsW (M82 family)